MDAKYIALIAGILLPSAVQPVVAGVWSGDISAELRYFPDDALSPAQYNDENASLAFKPEYYHEWDNRRQGFTFIAFARLDQNDEERSHADIRELNHRLTRGDWEWRFGIGKVFWGVTESQHLVDIINQTDLVENLDGEDKLGQPMIQATWLQDWGALEFFVLPAFRERSFPGAEGRLRTPLVVDTDRAEYESDDEQQHIDWALRSKIIIGAWEIGLAHFSGTARNPELLPVLDGNGNPVLVPRYNLIDQSSLDVSAILGNWLWKLEAIYQDNPVDSYAAAVGGFEYTFYGIFESALDLGAIVEYHYDDRGEAARVPFQDDVFAGARLAFNDAQSTEILAGSIIDLDSDSRSFRIEASRRLGNSFKLSGELQLFSNIDPQDVLYSLRDDDYLQVELGWYF